LYEGVSPIPPEDRVCDFCGEPRPGWIYPAQTFRRLEEHLTEDGIGTVDHGYIGGWAACDACRQAREDGGLQGLLHRVVELKVAMEPTAQELLRQVLIKLLGDLYREFEANRTSKKPIRLKG
jgi:hypothetical protein